jgi:hypothetical protein
VAETVSRQKTYKVFYFGLHPVEISRPVPRSPKTIYKMRWKTGSEWALHRFESRILRAAPRTRVLLEYFVEVTVRSWLGRNPKRCAASDVKLVVYGSWPDGPFLLHRIDAILEDAAFEVITHLEPTATSF